MKIRILTCLIGLVLFFSSPGRAQSSTFEANAGAAVGANLEEDLSVAAPGGSYEPAAPYQEPKGIPAKGTDFQWKGALGDSFKVLMLQNSLRIVMQQKTRDGLSGPFLHDYVKALQRKQSP